MKTIIIKSIMLAALLLPFAPCGRFFSASTNLLAQQTNQANNAAASAAGSWQVSWKGRDGSQKQGSMQITQTGTNLSGSFQAPRGSTKLSGNLQGNQVSMQMKVGGKQITMSGTLEGDRMSGTMGQGNPWSATRQ
jgi:hypothetical protein